MEAMATGFGVHEFVSLLYPALPHEPSAFFTGMFGSMPRALPTTPQVDIPVLLSVWEMFTVEPMSSHLYALTSIEARSV